MLRNGKKYDILPFGSEMVIQCEPIYEEMPGWNESTAGITEYNKLPVNARNYLKRIENIVEVPIDIIRAVDPKPICIVLAALSVPRLTAPPLAVIPAKDRV